MFKNNKLPPTFQALNSTLCNFSREFAAQSAAAATCSWPARSRALRLLVFCSLGWATGTEAQTTGYSTELLHNQVLLQEPSRFGALEVAFPRACMALPDSLRQFMEAQVNEAKPHGFQYEIEHACGFADGHTLVLSSIVNQEPSLNFAYLEGYEPVERGLQDSLQVRSLYSGEVALREYSFARSGFSVKQVFVETPQTVYQLDMLIRDTWTDSAFATYESVLSSIYIIH